MNFSVFLKVFGDICLYFGCICALPALFPHDFYFLWPALAWASCSAIAAVLSDQGRSGVRYSILLLAVFPILPGKGIMDLLMLLPPAVYVICLILRDEWSLEYFAFSSNFRRMLTIFGIAVILVHFGVLIENRSDFTHVLDSSTFLQHYLFYAVCGIILQRQLRLGSDGHSSRYLNTQQLILITGSTGALVLSISLAERYLSRRGASLGQWIGRIIQYLVSVPLALMNKLFILLSEMETAKMDQFKEEHYSDIDPTPVMPMEEMQQLLQQTPQEEAAFPWWLALLLLAVFTCILILLSGVLHSRRSESEHTETIAQIAPRKKRKAPSGRSNRSKLRRIYREFLKTEKRRGHKLLSCHTSADILENLKHDDHPDAAAKLRSLYLSARYDLNSPVTARQVQEAKDALKRYKND